MPSLESQRNQSSKSMPFGQVDFSRSDQIVAFVEGRYAKRAEHRLSLERQWYINIAQYLGYQYHTWDGSLGSMRLAPTKPHRVRLVCNRLMPIVKKVVSKILRQRPQWNVIPATNDTDDASKAIVGSKVLKYYWRYMDMDQILVKTMTWMATTGNVFMRVYWDPEKGPEVSVDPFEALMLPEDQQKMLKQGITPHLGDPCVEMASPFEIDVDPEADCMENIRELIHSKCISIDALKGRYGSKAMDLKGSEKGQDSTTNFYEKRLKSLAGSGAFAGVRTGEDSDDNIVYHSLWVNPTKKLPRGKYCVVAGGKLLHSGDLPNGFKKIPYVHMQETPVPGRFWGTCALEQCIPLQAAYNRGRSQLIENVNVIGRPKWLNPKNSGVMATAFDNNPGEVIEYQYGAKPEMVSPPNMPEYPLRLLEYALKDMEDVSSIHEVTQARAPSGVRSGVAIAQLQEQDDQMLAPTFLVVEKALSKIGAWLLQLVADNVTEERLFKISGKSNQVDAMTFMGSDLVGKNKSKPGVNYFDVETQIGSQLPLSSAARKDFVLSLIQSGLFNPQDPADRKKIFTVLELGTEETVINDDSLDRQNAIRENAMLSSGQYMEPHPRDNDMIHIEEHRRFQKSPDYFDTVQPEGDQMIEAHIQGHELKAQMLANPTMAPPQTGASTPETQDPGAEPFPPIEEQFQEQF